MDSLLTNVLLEVLVGGSMHMKIFEISGRE